MSLPPPHIPLGANAAAALAGSGEGTMVRVEVTRMPAQLMARLAEAVRPVLIVGAIAERNRDGTVRLRTQNGDLTLRLPVEAKTGRTISVQLPPSPGLTAGLLASQPLSATALLPRDALPQGLRGDALEPVGSRPAETAALTKAGTVPPGDPGKANPLQPGRLPSRTLQPGALQPGTIQPGAPRAPAPAGMPSGAAPGGAVAVRLLQMPAGLTASLAAGRGISGAAGPLRLSATVAGTGADGTARLLTASGEVHLRAPLPLRTGTVVTLQLVRAATTGGNPAGPDTMAAGGGPRTFLILPQSAAGAGESLPASAGRAGQPAFAVPGDDAASPLRVGQLSQAGRFGQAADALRFLPSAAMAAYRSASGRPAAAGALVVDNGFRPPMQPQKGLAEGPMARPLPESLLAPQRAPPMPHRLVPATIRPVPPGPASSGPLASGGNEPAASPGVARAKGEASAAHAARLSAPSAEAVRPSPTSIRAAPTDRGWPATPPAAGSRSVPATAEARSLSPLLQAQSDRPGTMAGQAGNVGGAGRPAVAGRTIPFLSPFGHGGDPPESGRSDPLPSLRQALTALAQAQPGLAEQVVRSLIPQPNAALPATLLLFLSALRGGDIRSWLGDRMDKALEAAGRRDLVGRLAGEFGALSRQAAESQQQPQDWRTFQVPIYCDGSVSAIRLAMRREDDGAAADGEDAAEGSRFLIELALSRLGPLQLDGVFRAKSLALTVRSHRMLPLAMRRELGEVLDAACGAVGLAAGLTFQAGPTTFRHPHQPG